MESSFKPLTSREIYEGCLTSSERSEYMSASSLKPSLSPSSTAREYYQGLRTPEYWWELTPSRVDTIGAVDNDGDRNGDGHGDYPIIPSAANIPRTSLIGKIEVHDEHLAAPPTSLILETMERTILLADRVAKVADDVVFRFQYYKAECTELKAKTKKLETLLRQAARADLYGRPLSRIIDETERALQKALNFLLNKCRAKNGIMKRRVFMTATIPDAAFKKVTAQLENSIGEISGVLAFYANPRDLIFLFWVLLHKKGSQEDQEDAAQAIRILSRDRESVEQMILAGVGKVFAQILKQGNSMKLQSLVAWAISELASSHPKCQDHFAQNNITLPLVGHLIDFETDQEHSKGSELYDDDPATNAEMKAMAARALWKLSKGNPRICRSIITDSPALHCFAVLLEKGPEQVQYNSAMALKEIAALAEWNADLRRSAFNHNSPATKTVVDQLLRIVQKADSDRLVIPCINAIGSLAETSFPATETRRIFRPLVRLLHERDGKVMREAVIALTKFACRDNYFRNDHSKAILNAGGAKHLVQLAHFGDQMVQTVSLVLLCYTALYVPRDVSLAQVEALTVLEWASKQRFMEQDFHLKTLLPEAKRRLEPYQSRGSS